MKHAETVTFGGSGLDRAEDLRRDPEALARHRAGARVLPLWRGKVAMNAARDGLAYVDSAPQGLEVFLGQDAAGGIWARDVSGWTVDGADQAGSGFSDPSEQTHANLPKGAAFCELRGVMTQLSARDAELAATARAMVEWHRTHGFCANCGAASVVEKAGWSRTCGACGRFHFPRTDPVVIMLITHGNSVLVGRSPGWPEGMYSLLAGFVEPGETLEAAVRREVWEETGVQVGSVGYLASQPWPFPASLMFGCWGQATSTALNIDPEEIEDAKWITREGMMAAFAGEDPTLLPARKGSIAHFLLENWLADTLD